MKGKITAKSLTGQSNPVGALLGATIGSRLAVQVAQGNPLVALGITGAAATMGSGFVKGMGQGATLVLASAALGPAISQFTSSFGMSGGSASGATDAFGTVVA